MLQTTYNGLLVLLSLLVASLASYTTLDLTNRINRLANPRYRRYWLIGGAFAMGLGIWSMHFIGMLAMSLAIPLGYDALITAGSLLIAMVVSYFALSLVTSGDLSTRKLIEGGTLMGIGIVLMHYSGMFALKMYPAIEYDPLMFAASVGVAVVASIAALWIAFTLRGNDLSHLMLRRLGAAGVMGGAITGMHFTGMGAAHFAANSVCLAANGINLHWLAALILLATVAVLGVTLVLSVLDARMESSEMRYTSSLKAANEELLHQATHDALTGLPNRTVLNERIQHAINTSERAQRRFAVYFMDLDGFKAVNDSLGHRVGDSLLKELATRLRINFRKEDLVARFGGDEFVVLVEDVVDADNAAAVAEKLFASFEEEFDLLDSGLRVSPSIGIALYPEDGDTIEALLKNADAAMYQAKAAGRNTYRFFETAMNAAAQRTMQIQRSLYSGLRNNQFFLEFQPKFDCRQGGTLMGLEALLRWHHPELGLVSPAEFIPIAERAGLIGRLGQWVVEETCRHIRTWEAKGAMPVKVAINLSVNQLSAPDLAADMVGIVKRHGIEPERILFEITESVAMHDSESNVEAIGKLQQMGFGLSIDDFGTGYSSLSYLQKFAVGQLKVDRSFVSALDRADEKSLAIVSTIIGLAHSLKMEVVAEGVETGEQLSLLSEMQCDQVQGFLLGRPVPSETVLSELLTPGGPQPRRPSQPPVAKPGYSVMPPSTNSVVPTT
jgi:diguanylate cyclase (GGDEF)-like protein